MNTPALIRQQDFDKLATVAAFSPSYDFNVCGSKFSSKSATVLALDNHDWHFRCIAIELLTKHWDVDRVELRAWYDSWLADTNPRVRRIAISMLGSPRNGCGRSWINDRLVEIMRKPDSHLTNEDRQAVAHSQRIQKYLNQDLTDKELVADAQDFLEKSNQNKGAGRNGKRDGG